MPVLTAFPCTGCQCGVQISTKECGYFGKHSTQLTSNGCAPVCRGQGPFYATRKSDQERTPSNSSEHFNFIGTYRGLCCYCALKTGLHLKSFLSAGCYACKRRRHLVMVVTEFARLKRWRSGDAIPATALPTGRWAALPHSLVDTIIAMAINGSSRSPFFLSTLKADAANLGILPPRAPDRAPFLKG